MTGLAYLGLVALVPWIGWFPPLTIWQGLVVVVCVATLIWTDTE